MSDFDNFDQMADEVAGKNDIASHQQSRPTARPNSYQFEPEEEPTKKQSCCTCSLPLILVILLFALVLGVTGIAAFNLYSNITNNSRLAIVETEAQQQSDTVIEVFNGTNNHEVELALDILRMNVTAEFSRLSSDLDALKSGSLQNFTQIRQDVESFVMSVENRFQNIENSTLAKTELLMVETQLANLMNRVGEIEQTLSSGTTLLSRYSLIVGLATFVWLYFYN